jgi:hypothetical protein
MKKIFLLFTIFFPVVLFAQPTGDGSLGNPYRGTITTPWTLSGDKYCGDLTVSSGTFTISAGSTLRFGAGNSLTISGTGVISAVGNSSNYITFTASGTSWGHIYFNTSASTNSQFSNCIIEKGDARLLGDTYGGGILVRSNNLIISNSIFQLNLAGYGAGVFLDGISSFSISNCIFRNNSAAQLGGGIMLWNGASCTLTNCLFFDNYGFYGGGGLFIGYTSDAKIINCDIINNNGANGRNVFFYYASNPTFKNCIIWGSNLSIYYLGQTPATSDFVYCAIQDPVSGSTTNCITLNASNSDPAGPNFVNPATSDWSIQFVSPCRDAGTDAGAPTYDIIGNSRIGITDIGAYEVQYSRWTGATSAAWGTNTNWQLSLLPISSSNAVIPNVATGPSISASDVTVVNLVTEPGGLLTVGAGRLLTATKLTNAGSVIFNTTAKGTITTIANSGILKLESDATTVSSLITNSFSGNGATVELNLNGGEENSGDHDYRWHYISTPVASIVIADIFQPVTYNVLGWYDGRVTGTLVTGWAAYDGWLYYTVPPGYGGPTFSTLTPGIGYDYYASSNHEYTFSGQLNTGDFPMALTFASPQSATLNGYNLLGNPYSAGINWDDIANGVYNAYPGNTSKGLNYTKNNLNIYYNSGISVPDGAATGIIPPMQGFFVKTYGTGNSITIPAAARTHSINPVRYKGSQIIPLVRLSVTENGVSDEAVVRFDALAKSDLDFDFDAVKMGVSTTNTQIYSVSGNVQYAINGQPFPESSVEIPIVVNLLIAGNHSINTLKLQGLDNYKVTLTDKLNNITVDLKTVPSFSFTSDAGTVTNRLVLKISNVLTGVEDPVVSKNTFNIYPANNFINIKTMSDDWDGKTGTVRVMDLTGKNVSNLNNAEFSKNSMIEVEAPAAKGLYVVEIRSGVMRYVGKVIIR